MGYCTSIYICHCYIYPEFVGLFAFIDAESTDIYIVGSRGGRGGEGRVLIENNLSMKRVKSYNVYFGDIVLVYKDCGEIVSFC